MLSKNMLNSVFGLNEILFGFMALKLYTAVHCRLKFSELSGQLQTYLYLALSTFLANGFRNLLPYDNNKLLPLPSYCNA